MQKNIFNTSLKIYAAFIVFVFVLFPVFSQKGSVAGSKDSLLVPLPFIDTTVKGGQETSNQKVMELDDALKLVKMYYNDTSNWDSSDDALRKALKKLIIYLDHGPIDTTLNYLKGFPFQVLSQHERELLEEQARALEYPDTSRIEVIQPQDISAINDSVLHVKKDSLISEGISPGIRLATDSVFASDSAIQDRQQFFMEFDTAKYEKVVVVDETFKEALDAIVSHIENDSVNIWIHNIAGDSINVTIKRDADLPQRFWLKNEVFDSLGLWVEVMDRGKLRLATDDGIDFDRLKYGRNRKRYTLKQYSIDESLKDVKLAKIEPKPWDIDGLVQLTLSQVYYKNWTRGGENSVSTLLRTDLDANYTKGMYRWNNSFRLKLGLIGLAEEGIRKNEDSWEIKSDFGIKASKRWYYSLSFNLKSQLAKGYKYPNDSVYVSNFLSPGYLYSALGLEYKPKKNVSVLLSPLTFKSVFVIDTSGVEHTLYGIPSDQKAKNDVGVYINIQHKYNFTEDIQLENRFHLFTNYNGFNKLDFDWEPILRVKVGPFFSFNFSMHFIYDSDVTLPVFDDSGTEVGRKAKLQFKEWVGFGLLYKF